jgi:ketosteroid isomerase-like protein
MADHATLFDDIDSLDPDRFAPHLAEDVVMRFGNAEPVHGRTAVRDVWAAFCDGVRGVSHAQVDRWEVGEATIVQADVTYTRRDGSSFTIPVVTIYRGAGELIEDYRVFLDLAPLAG